jgi:anti-sigma-K factor RskA
MSDRHANCGEDVAPYALGALPPEDARAFERHLAECELCRTDLDALSPVVHALSETPEPVDPPPELRRRLMAVVEQEAAERHASERAAGRAPRGGWTRWLPRPLPALAAACVLLVAGIGIGIGLNGDDPTTLGPASAPAGVEAELRLDDDGGELVVHGMGQLPDDRVMQVWLVRGEGGAPEPTDSLFTPNRRGDASVAVPGEMEGVTRVLVSEEPRGGSRSPTTAPALDFRVQST